MPWAPLGDVSETDDAYIVRVELPGVNKDQVDVQLQGGELVITGEIPEDSGQAAAATAARAAPAGSSSGPTCPATSTPKG